MVERGVGGWMNRGCRWIGREVMNGKMDGEWSVDVFWTNGWMDVESWVDR